MQGGETLCRPIPHTTRIITPNKDVAGACANVWTSVGFEPTMITSPLLPHFMISSCLNLSCVPRALLDKTSDAVRLDDIFNVKSLPFTDEEKRFLESSEPDPELVLDQILESSGVRKKIKFRVDGNQSSSLPRRAPCALPLAKITERRIDYKELLQLPEVATEQLCEALSWITTDRLRNHVVQHPLFSEMRAKASHHVSRHVAGDMQFLHSSGIFESHPWTSASLEVPIFKVPKSGNVDSRLIGDARSINKLLPRLGPMELPELPKLIRMLLSKRYLFQRDARSYFYAFGLCDQASDVFSIRWCNKRGKFSTSRWKVMPQGFSMAPRIAQLTSLHLAKNAMRSMEDAILVPWVDNFLAGTDDLDAMSSLMQNFYSVCDKCNVELKPTELPPGKTMDAIGIHFDVSADDVGDHFVELQADFKEQMTSDRLLIGDSMTARQYFQVFGGLMWANYAIARQPLCRWKHAMSSMREIAIAVHKSGRQEAWDEHFEVSKTTQSELHNMSNLFQSMRRTYRELEHAPSTVDVFTDASSWAWGYLRTQPSLQGAHRVHSIKDIFVAELLAACEAWFSTSEEVPNLHVDNTAAVGALVKGHSSTGKGNLILSRLYECLPRGARARVTAVPTDCQRADLASRGVFAAGPPCDHKHLSRPVAWAM